jgi:membrane-associated phospholipid phosphatase
MRFADLGMTLAAALLAVWVGALVTLAEWQRRRMSGPSGGLRPVLVGVGGCAALVGAHIAVIDAVEDDSALARLDQPVLTGLAEHRDAVANALMQGVSAGGGTLGMTILAAAAVGVLFWRRLPVEAAVVAVTALGASALVTGFKHLYERARPPVWEQLSPETSFALPSGHALGSVAVLGILTAVGMVLARRHAVRGALLGVGVLGVGTIGISRLYLGVHWLTDVVAGWLLGGAWLAACVTALVLIRQGRGVHAEADSRAIGEVGDHARAPATAG